MSLGSFVALQWARTDHWSRGVTAQVPALGRLRQIGATLGGASVFKALRQIGATGAPRRLRDSGRSARRLGALWRSHSACGTSDHVEIG